MARESDLNRERWGHHDFGQLDTDFQAHGGSVNTGTSPKVQYAYADGSDNTIRPMHLVYPNGWELNLGYEAADGPSDLLSRSASLIDDDGTRCDIAGFTHVERHSGDFL